MGNALKAVAVMEATFGEGHPRNSTAYGSLAAFLKCVQCSFPIPSVSMTSTSSALCIAVS